MPSRSRMALALAFSALAVTGASALRARDSETAVRAVTPDEVAWESVPGYPPGYARAVLDGDAAKAMPVTYRVRLPPRFRFPPHRHASDERVTVLQGVWRLGVGDAFEESRLRSLPAGSFVVVPAGTLHFVTTDVETIIQVQVTGPVGFRQEGDHTR